MTTERLTQQDLGAAVIFANALGLLRRPTDTAKRSDRSSPRPHKRNWLERLDRWFWESRQRDVEAYLAGAKDIGELEERIRAIERESLFRG